MHFLYSLCMYVLKVVYGAVVLVSYLVEGTTNIFWFLGLFFG